MDCHDYQENITAYLQGELPFKEVMELHAHLGICETCAREEQELRQSLSLFDKYHSVLLPQKFDRELDVKLTRIEPASSRQQWPLRRVIFTIAATLLITFGLEFLTYQIFQESRTQDTFMSLTKTTQNFQVEKYKPSSRSGSETDYLKRYSSYFQKFYPDANKLNDFSNEVLRKN
ncbi:zf-HC2 domain-containing protein [candidate division KSB1 bacterium]|nr:zf-HC2 domain-containing protein [candidate division KSB1 bacterium]